MSATKGKLKAKHQRLVLVLLALAAIIAAGLIAAWALRNQANYFYLPDQLQADPPAPGQAVRLGGMVADGSLKTLEDGVTIAFVVTDQAEARVPVRYRGIVPDLFVEGAGVVAEGSLNAADTFEATNLLAKHDENYVPRELQQMDQQRAARMAEETTIGIE